jgi:hypothetical protein
MSCSFLTDTNLTFSHVLWEYVTWIVEGLAMFWQNLKFAVFRGNEGGSCVACQIFGKSSACFIMYSQKPKSLRSSCKSLRTGYGYETCRKEYSDYVDPERLVLHQVKWLSYSGGLEG